VHKVFSKLRCDPSALAPGRTPPPKLALEYAACFGFELEGVTIICRCIVSARGAEKRNEHSEAILWACGLPCRTPLYHRLLTLEHHQRKALADCKTSFNDSMAKSRKLICAYQHHRHYQSSLRLPGPTLLVLSPKLHRMMGIPVQ